MSAVNEILREIYGKSFEKGFVQFKKDAFDAVYKGSWSGHERKHRERALAYAIVATADQQSDKGQELELKRMLRWFCGVHVDKLRGRIRKILKRKKTSHHAAELDTVYAGRYERYLSCIPELIELGYVDKEEMRALDQYQAGEGILCELETKIGATS